MATGMAPPTLAVVVLLIGAAGAFQFEVQPSRTRCIGFGRIVRVPVRARPLTRACVRLRLQRGYAQGRRAAHEVQSVAAAGGRHQHDPDGPVPEGADAESRRTGIVRRRNESASLRLVPVRGTDGSAVQVRSRANTAPASSTLAPFPSHST